MDHMATSPGRLTKPRVKIVEQPAQQAPKFRYAVEGRVGSIPGANSTKDNKTYPTIEITNYVGRAIVVVSCVSVDDPPRPHPHKLMRVEDKCKFCLDTGLCKNYAISSEHCTDGLCALCKDGRCANCRNTNGICVVTIDVTPENRFVSFPNIGIQCVKKQEIKNSLLIRQKQNIDPYKTGFGHTLSPQSINLHAVRLCFQLCFIHTNKKQCIPVVSDVIYNAKKMPVLKLQAQSHYCGSAKGGTRVILLCKELKHEDVEVMMCSKVGGSGGAVWHQPAQINTIHMNCAIVFTTPPYKDPDTKHFAEAFIKLRSESSDDVSNSLRFIYVPDHQEPDYLVERPKTKPRPEIEKIANIVPPPGPPVEHNIKWNPYPTLNRNMTRTSRDANYMQPAPQAPSPHDMHRPSRNMTSVPLTSPDNEEMSINMPCSACVLSHRRVTPPKDQVLPPHEAMFPINSSVHGLQDHERQWTNRQGDMLGHKEYDADYIMYERDYLEQRRKTKLRPKIIKIANIVPPPGPPVEHNIKWIPYPTLDQNMPRASRDTNYMQSAHQVPSTHDMHRPSRNMSNMPVTSTDNQEKSIEMPCPACHCALSLRQVTPPKDQVLPQHEAMFPINLSVQELQGDKGLIYPAFEYIFANRPLPLPASDMLRRKEYDADYITNEPDYLKERPKTKLPPKIEKNSNIVPPPGPPAKHNIKWNPYRTRDRNMPRASRDANCIQPAQQVPSLHDMNRPSSNMTSVAVTSPDNQEMSIEILSPTCVLSPRQVTPPQDPVLLQHEVMSISSSVQDLQGHEGTLTAATDRQIVRYIHRANLSLGRFHPSDSYSKNGQPSKSAVHKL